MDICIFQLPYDSGRREVRMGLGPGHMLRNGLEAFLHSRGHSTSAVLVDLPEDGFPAEITTSFALYRKLASAVQERCKGDSLPLVLSGNCGGALGGIAGLEGLDKIDLGVIWFDAHGDFNTPDTTSSGFLDGMGLATAAGLGWKNLAQTLPGYHPIAAENIVHVGGREFDPAEYALLRDQQIALVTAPALREQGVRAALAPALDALRQRVSQIYLHLDLDVLDPKETPANHFVAPDGLSLDQVAEAVGLIRERFRIGGMGVASYDPSYDREGNTLEAAFRLIAAGIEK